MRILLPQSSIFGQPGFIAPALRQPERPIPANNLTTPSQDTFSLQQAESHAALRFAGHKNKAKDISHQELFEQFPEAFQPIIEMAKQKASESPTTEMTAEHLVWAAIQTLDSLAGWEDVSGRGGRASTRHRQAQAKQLAQALMPNYPNLTPEKVAETLRPLAQELGNNFDQNMQLDDTPTDLTLQRALGKAMQNALKSEEEGVEPSATQALFRKILWQVPPIPTFTNISNSARSLLQTLEHNPPSIPTDGTSSGDERSIQSNSSQASWDHFGKQLQDVSPGLARWVANSSKNMNGPIYTDVKMAPLSHIVASGIDAAKRELDTSRRQRPIKHEDERSQPFKTSLSALIPSTKDSLSVDKSFLGGILERSRKNLLSLPAPHTHEQAEEQALQSRQIVENFINHPARADYSLDAFVEFLKDQDAASQPGVSPDHARVGKVLTRIQEEASDTRIPIMEQFEKANPALLKYGTNMVRQGMDHQLPEVLLRREATDRMLAVLNTGGNRSNILMNAGSGEGKTFAVNGLAQRIADNDVPASMKNTQMVQLNMGALLGGNQFQGSLETKAEEIFKPLNKYLSDNPSRKVVVFIDEIHMIGELLDTMKSSGILEKPNLSFIGATTPDDWRKSPLRSDQAFQGRFHELALPSFNNKEKLAILGQVGTKLAHKTGVSISPEILEQTMLQSAAKWPENALRHASDLLGLSVSLAKSQPLELASLKDRVQHKELWINTLKAQKTLKGRFERQMKETETEVETLKRQIEAMEQVSDTTTSHSVKDKHLRQAMAVLTGERIGVLSQDELVKLRQAKEIMGRFIVGQSNALGTIEEGLREIAVRQKTGAVHNRPIASMLLCGPTGVGKTEVSKVIAKEFMNNNMLRLDMSDYMEKHNVSLLKGSPPGYVGHEDGGMVDEIRKNPNSVIVFDEIEKAHPDIFNVLLQILGEGELRDNKNQVVNFRNTLIVLTSNLHNKEIIELMTKKLQKAAKGSAAQKDPALAMRELETQIRQVLTVNPAEGREGFRPEHLGRLDYVIPFNPLTKQHVSDILDIRLREMNQSPFLKDNNLTVTLSDRARARLVELTAASSLPAKPVKPKAPEPAPATGGPNARRKKAVVPPPANDNTPLQGGARDVRINFDRFVNKKVFTDLTFEDHLADVENAQLVVDYDPKTQSFKVEARPNNTPIKPEKKAASGRTLAFA